MSNLIWLEPKGAECQNAQLGRPRFPGGLAEEEILWSFPHNEDFAICVIEGEVAGLTAITRRVASRPGSFETQDNILVGPLGGPLALWEVLAYRIQNPSLRASMDRDVQGFHHERTDIACYVNKRAQGWWDVSEACATPATDADPVDGRAREERNYSGASASAGRR